MIIQQRFGLDHVHKHNVTDFELPYFHICVHKFCLKLCDTHADRITVLLLVYPFYNRLFGVNDISNTKHSIPSKRIFDHFLDPFSSKSIKVIIRPMMGWISSSCLAHA